MAEENKVLILWITPALPPSPTSLSVIDFSEGDDVPSLLSLLGVISSQAVRVPSQPWKSNPSTPLLPNTPQKPLWIWHAGPEALWETSLEEKVLHLCFPACSFFPSTTYEDPCTRVCMCVWCVCLCLCTCMYMHMCVDASLCTYMCMLLIEEATLKSAYL